MKKIVVIGRSEDVEARRLLVEMFVSEKGFKIISMEEAKECGLIASASQSMTMPAPLDLKSFPELSREIPIAKLTGEIKSSNRATRRKSKPRKK